MAIVLRSRERRRSGVIRPAPDAFAGPTDFQYVMTINEQVGLMDGGARLLLYLEVWRNGMVLRWLAIPPTGERTTQERDAWVPPWSVSDTVGTQYRSEFYGSGSYRGWFEEAMWIAPTPSQPTVVVLTSQGGGGESISVDLSDGPLGRPIADDGGSRNPSQGCLADTNSPAQRCCHLYLRSRRRRAADSCGRVDRPQQQTRQGS